jgi:hypothetical protein
MKCPCCEHVISYFCTFKEWTKPHAILCERCGAYSRRAWTFGGYVLCIAAVVGPIAIGPFNPFILVFFAWISLADYLTAKLKAIDDDAHCKLRGDG